MKYTITIVVATFVFAALGLFAALGCAEYAKPAKPEEIIILFVLLPLGGAAAGLLAGCLGATLGSRFSQQERNPTRPVE